MAQSKLSAGRAIGISEGCDSLREREIPRLLGGIESTLDKINDSVGYLENRLACVSQLASEVNQLCDPRAVVHTDIGNNLSDIDNRLNRQLERINDILNNLEL